MRHYRVFFEYEVVVEADNSLHAAQLAWKDIDDPDGLPDRDIVNALVACRTEMIDEVEEENL